MFFAPLNFFISFLSNSQSRKFEYQVIISMFNLKLIKADEFAIKHGYGTILKSAIVTLFKMNKGTLNTDPV